MATTKRGKAGRSTTNRAKATGRGRATKATPRTAKKKATASRATITKAKAASGGAKAAPKAKATRPAAAVGKKPPVATRVAAPKRAAAPSRKPAAESPELVSLRAKFQRERNGLEKRLTEAVREIGMLRHHELRAMQLERFVSERDATIARLQAQVSELERRPAAPVYVHEVQQSLALGDPTPALETMDAEPELDEFEDDRVVDDGDLVSDEE